MHIGTHPIPREEVSSTQLRDDLLSMLVAGHETTGSALTWTLYLLVNNPDKLAKVCFLFVCLFVGVCVCVCIVVEYVLWWWL